MSCDLIPSEKEGKHYIGDVFDILDYDWDLMIAHPPCTHLATVGSMWFGEKEKDGRQQEAIDFFMALANAKNDKICVENPVGIMTRVWRKPDQYIQPYQFGDLRQKKTGLWLKNLPLLKETNNVYEEFKRLPEKEKRKYDNYGQCRYRSKHRSRFFVGIANAMADQWV